MPLFATGSTIGPVAFTDIDYHDEHEEADHTVTVVDHTADHSDMDAVSGDFTVAGNLLVGGDVDGDAVIVSTIDVGDITADSFDCRVNATVQGDLLVSGTGDFAGDVSLFTNSDMYINGPHANYYGGGCILDNTFMIGGPGPGWGRQPERNRDRGTDLAGRRVHPARDGRRAGGAERRGCVQREHQQPGRRGRAVAGL